MDKHDAIIFITPTVGEYHKNNVFFRNLSAEEIDFLGKELVVEYRHKSDSYTDCIKHLKEKMEKIQAILQE
jgi:hypothetical protein